MEDAAHAHSEAMKDQAEEHKDHLDQTVSDLKDDHREDL